MLKLTERQARVIEILGRAAMSWVSLAVILFWFSIFSVAFLVALFKFTDRAIATGIVGVIDGILAMALRIVLLHLFPPKTAEAPTGK